MFDLPFFIGILKFISERYAPEIWKVYFASNEGIDGGAEHKSAVGRLKAVTEVEMPECITEYIIRIIV